MNINYIAFLFFCFSTKGKDFCIQDYLYNLFDFLMQTILSRD